MITVRKRMPATRLWERLRSDESLTKKASLNAVAAGLDYAARLLVGFLLTPLLVAGMGDYVFGIWKVLSSVTGYLTAASGRPTQTLKFTLANLQNSTDYAEKRRHVGSAIAVWLLFCPLLLTLGGLIVWFFPRWLEIAPEYIWITRVAAAVSVLQMTLLSLVEIPHAIMEGENIGYKRMGASAILVLLGGGLTAGAIYLQQGIVGVAVAGLLATLLTGLFFLRVTHSYVHWLGVAKPTRAALGRFVGLSGWFLLWRLVMQFMLASDALLLGIFASVSLVTSYSLTKYLPETLVNLVAIVAFGIAPGLGGIIGTGDLPKANAVRGEIQLFTWYVATLLGSLTLLWNDEFLRLWVGPGYHAGMAETLLLMVMVVQFVLIRNDGNVIDLTLNPRNKVILGIVSILLSTGCAIGLMQLLEAKVVALCAGIILGRLLLTVSYPLIVGRFLQIGLAQQLRAVLRPGLVTALLFGALAWPNSAIALWSSTVATGWFGLIGGGGLSAVALAGLLFFAGMTGPQRAQIVRRIRRMVEA